MLAGRVPAYKTAIANVAYIWRDSSPTDRSDRMPTAFARMPTAFARRRDELHGAGLILPTSAPVWASEGYTIWQEADAATAATNNPDAIAAWHMILEIPSRIPRAAWRGLIVTFVERHLAAKGKTTAWAIHALRDEDEWLVEPHAHLVVSERGWRHDMRLGRRQVGGVGSWGGQRSLELSRRRGRQRPATAFGRATQD